VKTEKCDVLVAGAGPVGLTAAMYLTAQGLKTTVVDAKPNGVTHSYALALHPATLDLLEAFGVLDEVLRQAIRIPTVAVHAGGRRIAAVPVATADARHPFLAVLGQDVLEDILVKALAREGVRVQWSHRLSRFKQHAQNVEVEVDELEERVMGYAAARFDWLVRRTHSIEASFLIGADGHGSLVRRQLDLGFEEIFPAQEFAVFEFAGRSAPAGEVTLVLHEDGLGVHWPLPDARARWSFAVDPEVSRKVGREKNHEPVQVIGPGMYEMLVESFLADLLAQRVPWWPHRGGEVYWRMLVRFENRLATAFGRGRVWLAGDAAHLTGPAGIQSMNIGMREAGELSKFLLRTWTKSGSIESLQEYENSRQQEWRRMLGLSGEVTARGDAPPEVVKCKDELMRGLPASGEALGGMLSALGLEWKA